MDEFLLAIKQLDTDALRGEASNVVNSMPTTGAKHKRPRLPKPQRIYLAVHRHDNMLYFERLALEAFVILTALNRGKTVEESCIEALSTSTRTNLDWPLRIKQWSANWTSLGWFCRPKQ